MTPFVARVARSVPFALSLGLLACGDASPAPDVGAASADGDAGLVLTTTSSDDAGGTTSSGGEDSGHPAPPPTPSNEAGTTPTDAGGAVPPEASGGDAQASASGTKLVAYLPDYNGTYTDWAKKIDFTKMTHMNLAFTYPPDCGGTCTASSDMTFSIDSQSDGDIAAIVTAAHAAGVKVLVSVGGGGSTNPLMGDQAIIQFYKAGLSTQLVASLDTFVSAHGFDGVDLDIESPGSMGAPYATFVSTVVSTFRPEGKLITAAMAQWIQSGIPTSALHQFDFIDIMTYSNLSDAQGDMTYYAGLNVPANQIVLGLKFFGDVQDPNDDEPEYSDILSHYPNAWQTDSVSGDSSYYGGDAIDYTGEATMAKETQLGAQYGGVMVWELTGDAPAPHSLLAVVQKSL